MAYYIWSEEQFPGSAASGRQHEYAQVIGLTILIPEKHWLKLESRYTEGRRHDDWQDRQGHAGVHVAEDVAAALEEKYGFRGLISTEEEPGTTQARALQATAKQRNEVWRRTVVEDFLAQRRAAEVGRPGRLLPNAYETECFTVLGITIPNTVDAMRTAQAPPIVNVTISREQIAAADKAVPADVMAAASARTAGEPPAAKGGR